ncbi:hypothetical protein DUQ17_22375 [Salmonella enterica subsp. diarizonae]|nr:hypothetical protein [Salmonella enterica subsp. diarizonae]
MAGKRLHASVIIDLNGNLSRRSRQYSNQINAMSRSSQGSLRALRMEVTRVSGAIDKMGSLSTHSFRMLSAGALGVVGAGYTANKLFINAAAQREQQLIAMNSLFHGDKAKAQAMMVWAKQNAKDTTWGLGGVLDEIRSSKGFGMNDGLTKQFITMLQDQGAQHGWDLSAAQGASLQLKQMFARQQIMAADANLLTGYGINVYQVLADAWGKDVKEVRKQGEKGKLGLRSILDLFKALSEQSKGAQAAAMNSWSGMTAQMGANWNEFAVKVMNSGPFDELKAEMRGLLKWHDAAGASGDLDKRAEDIGKDFLTVFRTVKAAAKELWGWLKTGKDALSWIDENVVSLKKLVKVLGAVWLANKVLRAGWAVAKPSWQVASYPFKTGARIWRRMRGRQAGRLPAPGEMTPDKLLRGLGVQRVFVTNWPRGFGTGSGGLHARKRRLPPPLPRQPLLLSGPKPLALPPPVQTLPAPRSVLALPPPGGLSQSATPGKKGLPGWLTNSAAGQLVSRSTGKLADAGRMVGNLFSGAGNRLAGSPLGRMAAKGAGALGWMGKGVGRMFSRLGGPVLATAQLAPVLLDDQASAHDKGGAIGSAAGAWLGGAVGSLAGPLGTVAGATLGSVAGEYLGGFVTDLYQKWTAPENTATEQKVNAEASLRIDLGEGLRLTNTRITEDGMGLNVYAGDNYITGW